jgi:3-methyl-2-oxobutanoate hydroxymethyltransferase
VNALGGYRARGRDDAEAAKILADARAVAEAGCFALVLEGVMEEIAVEVTRSVACPTIGIGASAKCDGQVLVTEDMLGLFERTPRFVKRYDDLASRIGEAAATYAAEVKARSFPTEEQIYRAPK